MFFRLYRSLKYVLFNPRYLFLFEPVFKIPQISRSNTQQQYAGLRRAAPVDTQVLFFCWSTEASHFTYICYLLSPCWNCRQNTLSERGTGLEIKVQGKARHWKRKIPGRRMRGSSSEVFVLFFTFKFFSLDFFFVAFSLTLGSLLSLHWVIYFVSIRKILPKH